MSARQPPTRYKEEAPKAPAAAPVIDGMDEFAALIETAERHCGPCVVRNVRTYDEALDTPPPATP